MGKRKSETNEKLPKEKKKPVDPAPKNTGSVTISSPEKKKAISTKNEPDKPKKNVTKIDEEPKKKKRKIRKKRKKIEKKLDISEKAVNDGVAKGNRKSKTKEDQVIPDHDDFKEGKRKKRKKREIPDYMGKPYQFRDALDVAGGDAREHFKLIDDGHDRNVWCERRGFWIFSKLCGRYVTPKCKNKIRCPHYDYAMEIKYRYNMSTVELTDKPEKKEVLADADVVDEAIIGD